MRPDRKSTSLNTSHSQKSPVHKNAYIGKLCVYIKNEKILELDICSEKEIDKLGFLDYLKIFVTNNISNMEKAM